MSTEPTSKGISSGVVQHQSRWNILFYPFKIRKLYTEEKTGFGFREEFRPCQNLHGQ
uniref:Uncharacterized protein n=1 Tax=Physcomitrium patens TaxID=3218 RepID=A0A2K1LBU2_PHYPA|nr:hypothetical protein PHYPA_001924 [Physcomitrium patens]